MRISGNGHAGQAQSKEARIEAIRREAEEKGRVELPGIRPAGAPIPIASPETGYYGQHLLKEPQWTKLIPFYFFVGGASGSLGVIGSLADVLGREEKLALTARWMAFGGSVLSGVLLVADLGRPSRFINMLRVFKPQSAMSMGSWVLSGFSASAGLSSFADFLRARLGDGFMASSASVLGRTGCVLFGMPFHDYTGVLIGATAIPVWNEHVRALPIEFGMSGLQSAVSLLELAGYHDRTALNVLGLTSAAVESAEFVNSEMKKKPSAQALKKGSAGLLVRAGAVLSGPLPIALRVASMFAGKGRARTLRRLAACSGIAGSLCMRYGWVEAGAVSARDWRLPLKVEERRAKTRQQGSARETEAALTTSSNDKSNRKRPVTETAARMRSRLLPSGK
ncbi:MAG: polysulfide reductase NrfD [Acidobacteriaceae bacterium]|nr:polysulfide reductase NrfD [Acidobacteriaceae bacterium]